MNSATKKPKAAEAKRAVVAPVTHLLMSVFTPTHDTTHLKALYESLTAQSFANWEWIVVENGNAKIDDAQILHDSRVKITRCPVPCMSVGALKKMACGLCAGDILVEADHDDMLTPDCLAELAAAFENPEIGFAYSDNARLGLFQPFNPAYGWDKPYVYNHQGTGLPAMASFEPDAAGIGLIWYAPDHVRAWRKSVYEAIGGHNSNLDILDDQELMIRTYLNTRMARIAKVLYIYRNTGSNTNARADLNQRIQTETVAMWHQWGAALMAREAELKGLLRLDLGGAFNSPPGFQSVDLKDADILANLNERWPFADGSAGVLRAHHLLEHLSDKQHAMSEIYRVLADGGWADIEVPSTEGQGAFADPTHVSFWCEASFFYYTRAEQAAYIRNNVQKFQAFRLDTEFPNDYFRSNRMPCVTAWLRVVKSESRRPHLQTI